MFDIGFWELMMIAVVALVVIGPERLPGVARSAGKWVGRLRRFITDVKADIDKEIRAEEIRKAIDNNADLSEIKRIMNEPIMDTDRFLMEDDDKKPEYQVKAIPDEAASEVNDDATELEQDKTQQVKGEHEQDKPA